MKTIDLLVQALPAIGGWPEKVTHIGQDYDRELMFYGRGNVRSGIFLDQLAADHRKHGERGTKITSEQYEAALAAKNDGWIDWVGGKHPPVSTNTVVDVKFKNGNVQSGYPAGEYSWVHAWQSSNIIAYRLHQPQEVEQTKAGDEIDLNECIGQDAASVWNGEGLPPVGCECQYRKHKKSEQSEWFTGVVKYASEFTVVIQPVCYPGETVGHPVNFEFRKVSSEADKKRDKAVKTIMLTGWCQSAAEEIYDLVAAGKVPGMKLED